jgi:hypothetical protein
VEPWASEAEGELKTEEKVCSETEEELKTEEKVWSWVSETKEELKEGRKGEVEGLEMEEIPCDQ